MNDNRDDVIGWRDLQARTDGGVLLARRLGPAKLALSAVAFVALVLLLGWFSLWLRGEGGVAHVGEWIPQTAEPMKRIHFSTDGTLPDSWLARQHGLKPGISLMDVDVYAIRQRLERCGQVKRAVVKRVFPDTLHIEVVERKPLFRMAADLGQGRPVMVYAVAEDGTVFETVDPNDARMLGLPYLGGVALEEIRDGVTRIAGIPELSHWMETAAARFPEYCADVRVVSLERYEGGDTSMGAVLITRGRDFPEVTLRSGAGDESMLRLRSAADWVRQQGRTVSSIDLSVYGEAVIR